MKAMLSFVLLLVALTANASPGQPYFVRQQSASSSDWTPASSTNIWFWWNYNDLPSNSNVTNWYDRIQNKAFSQTTPASQPTNSISGVVFSGGQTLLDYPATFYNGSVVTNLWHIIFTPNTPALDGTTVFGGDGNAGQEGNRSLQTWTGGLLYYQGAVGSAQFGRYIAGKEMDCTICTQPENLVSIWTNGVIAVNGTLGSMGFVGVMGARLDINRFYNGKIREVIWFTNSFDASQMVSNLHKYSTNAYGYTP